MQTGLDVTDFSREHNSTDMQHKALTENSQPHHCCLVFVAHFDHKRKQFQAGLCTRTAAAHTAAESPAAEDSLAVQEARRTAVEDMVTNMAAEDTEFLVDIARNQLQRSAEDLLDCMAVVEVGNSLQKLI